MRVEELEQKEWSTAYYTDNSLYEGACKKMIIHFAPKGFSITMLNLFMDYIKTVYNMEINTLHGLLELIEDTHSLDDICVIKATKHQKSMIMDTLKSLKTCVMSLYELVSICSIDGFGKRLSKEYEKYISNICHDGILNDILYNKPILLVKECNNSKARASWKNRHNLLKDVMDSFKIKMDVVHQSTGLKNACISGKLHTCTKEQFKKHLLMRGFKFVDGVTKKTDLLITNLLTHTKAEKAMKLGISIASEEQFLSHYNKI